MSIGADRCRPEMLAFLPERRDRVLEVGCHTGIFAASLEGTKEVWGVEPNSEAARVASNKIYKVINATFEEAASVLPQKYFDLVICNDVIEHMVDYDGFLQAIKIHMSRGGVIVGSIPNIRYYGALTEIIFAKDWNYRESGILDKTHLRFFTEKSFRRALEVNGFIIEKMHGINGGIRLSSSRWALCSALAAYGAIILSLGSFSDVRHLQFGFRARPVAEAC